MPLSDGLLVPEPAEGIHQSSSPVLRYWPEKTDVILKTYINLVKILREYMHQKKALAQSFFLMHVFPEYGTKS